MEIEEVAKDNPARHFARTDSSGAGFAGFPGPQNRVRPGLAGEVANSAIPFLQALYRCFIDTDASMLEINPCVLTGDGKLVALDAKMTFDDTRYSPQGSPRTPRP